MSTSLSGVIKCYVCLSQMRVELAHEHHIIPRASSAVDSVSFNSTENTVWLCPNCHGNLHRIADKLLHKKSSEAVDLATSAYPEVNKRGKIIALAKNVVEYTIMRGNLPSEEFDELDHHIDITLPNKVYTVYKDLASEHKHNGRKVGVARLIRALLIQYARKYRSDL